MEVKGCGYRPKKGNRMPKFEWGVTLVMERQKCVPLIIEAKTLEEAEKKVLTLFDRYFHTLDMNKFKAMFPDVSLEHDEFDDGFEDAWNKCRIYP